MTMRKKSHLLLSHKRMNRYQLDVGLCKHKKIVGGDYSVFLAYEARNLNIIGLNSRVEWEKLTSVCDYAIVLSLTPFVELKYGKRMIPVKLHELTTREASDVITRWTWTFCAHQEQNLIHAARNLNARILNNRANDDSFLHDSTAW